MQLLCKITYIACIIILVASSGLMQHLNEIIWAANFCNLSLFKLECQYAFCFCGIWICIHECDVCLHTHPYSCKCEESHHLWNERNHLKKSKVVFAHRNDIFSPTTLLASNVYLSFHWLTSIASFLGYSSLFSLYFRYLFQPC